MNQDKRYSHRGFVVEEGYATAAPSDKMFFQAQVAEQMLLQQEQRWMDALLGGPTAPPAPKLSREQIIEQITGQTPKELLTPNTPRGWIMHPTTWSKMQQAYWPIKEGKTGISPFFGVAGKLIYIDDATPLKDIAVIPHMHFETFQTLVAGGMRPLAALVQCNLDFKKQHTKALARHRKKRRPVVDAAKRSPFQKPRNPSARKGRRK